MASTLQLQIGIFNWYPFSANTFNSVQYTIENENITQFITRKVPACTGLSLYTWSLQWRHNGRDRVSNHQPRDCLLNRLFRRKSTKTSKLRVTGLCAGNSPGTGELCAQMTSYAENVSIWWRHHDQLIVMILDKYFIFLADYKYSVYEENHVNFTLQCLKFSYGHSINEYTPWGTFTMIYAPSCQHIIADVYSKYKRSIYLGATYRTVS